MLTFDDNDRKLIEKIIQIILIVIVTVISIFCLVKWGEQLKIFIVNFTVAILGGLFAIELMIYGYKRLDKLTTYDTSKELQRGNQAVGLVIGGLFTGIGIVIGLIVSLGVN